MVIELSLDLIEEILLRVPALSLAPWRYVCKQWKTLITDPRFVKKHLSYYRGHEQQFTVFNNITGGKSSTVSCVGIDYNEQNNNPSLNLKVLKPWDLFVYNMSHCDGLLLLVSRFKLLVLNPLLKEAKWIESSHNSHDKMDVYGLGYINDQEYKLVGFRCSLDSYRKHHNVGVYDFKSDSWKFFGENTSCWFYRLPISSVCLKGTPYWLGYDYIVQRRIWFVDFPKERFEPLSLPPIECNGDSICSLGIYKGDHLSFLHRSNNTSKDTQIWVMNKCWIKLMIVDTSQIETFHGRRLSYYIEKNGKIVISVYQLMHSSSVPIYIMGENQERYKLGYDVSPDVNCIIGDCYYIPSLLPVP